MSTASRLALMHAMALAVAAVPFALEEASAEPRGRAPGPLPFTGKTPRERPPGPPSRAREEARRRKQRARAGLPVVEPPPVDLNACADVD